MVGDDHAQLAAAGDQLGHFPGDTVALDRGIRDRRQALARHVVDELDYVPLSPTGAELLFEVFSRRYERGSTIVTSNLPFEDWTSVLGSGRLTGALLDRLTHHVHILTMNGDSYRLKQSAGRRRVTDSALRERPPSNPTGLVLLRPSGLDSDRR